MSNNRKAKHAKKSPAQKTPVHNDTANLADAIAEAARALKWSVYVKPGEPKVLGEHLPGGVMLMENRGPGGIHVKTGSGYNERGAILLPGETQMLSFRDQISIAMLQTDKSATLAFDFKLLPK